MYRLITSIFLLLLDVQLAKAQFMVGDSEAAIKAWYRQNQPNVILSQGYDDSKTKFIQAMYRGEIRYYLDENNKSFLIDFKPSNLAQKEAFIKMLNDGGECFLEDTCIE
jgi:hypothetical protein